MTIMGTLYQLLFFLTPFLLSTQNSEQFELPKMYFVYGLTFVILFLHLANYLQGKAPLFRRTFLDLPLSLFLISQLISTIFSIDFHTSFFGYYSRMNGGLLSLLVYSILYWILAIYINEDFKNKIINASLLAGLLIATYGILEHFGIDKNYWQQDVVTRVFSTLGQPNWLAAYLCILLPFSLDKFLTASRFIHKSYFILLTSIFYTCLLFTKSKSGILAAVISLGIYGLIYFLKNKSRKFLIFNFAFLFLLFLLISNPIKDYLFSSPTRNSQLKTENLNITPSEDIRKIVWSGALKLWQQFPFFGTGPETFAYSYYWVRPTSHNITSEWNFLYNKAHNEYLNYLATTGTLGFATYVLLILFTVYRLLITDYPQKFSIFAAYLSILITNSAGFSVAIVSLYFFLLPTFVLKSISFTPTPQKKSFYVLHITFYVLLLLFLETKILFYFLADITYASANNYDQNQKYELAYDQIRLSLAYRPDEPNYLIKSADIAAKLAIVTKDQKYIVPAVAAANLATKISTFDVNLWKQKAQVYYYLAAIDPQYFKNAINSLTTATKLAPTDAMAYYLLGTFYNSTKDDDNALVNYQAAFNLKPNYDHASFAIAKILFNQKKYSEAKKYFEKTLEIAPTNIEAKEYLNKISKN